MNYLSVKLIINIFIINVIFLIRLGNSVNLQKYFEWNILDFDYPNPQLKLNDLITGRLKLENALPVGIEIWNDKMFITVPRWKEGIPATLNYVPLLSPLSNPPLIPYPNLETNELGNCDNGLSTVYRIHVDECDRLWVLDTGTFGIGNTTQNPCPYALNIFDLKSDTRIHRYEFPKENINSRTFIANIAVDLGKTTCNEAYAYFSDELGYGLIVYSLLENKSWRFEHSYFLPDPLKGNFNIDNLNFQWSDEGIFGISLSPILENGYRILYFSPLASNREFAVSTEILQNSSKVEDSFYDFYYSAEERGPNTHTTSRLITKDGIQFFNLIDQNAVGCWNYRQTYSAENIFVAAKENDLIFPADVKVDSNNYLWVISDRMPKFLLSNLNYNEPNFRVYFAPVNVLVKNSPCSVRSSSVISNRRNDGYYYEAEQKLYENNNNNYYGNNFFAKIPQNNYTALEPTAIENLFKNTRFINEKL